MFVAPNLEFVRMLAKTNSSPVFHYRLSYSPALTMGDIFGGSILRLIVRAIANFFFNWDILREKNNTKVCHGDDVSLLFQFEGVPLRQRWSEEDLSGDLKPSLQGKMQNFKILKFPLLNCFSPSFTLK